MRTNIVFKQKNKSRKIVFKKTKFRITKIAAAAQYGGAIIGCVHMETDYTHSLQ